MFRHPRTAVHRRVRMAGLDQQQARPPRIRRRARRLPEHPQLRTISRRPVTRAPESSRWPPWSLWPQGHGGQTASSLVAARSAHDTQGRGHHRDLADAHRTSHSCASPPPSSPPALPAPLLRTGEHRAGQPASVQLWEQRCPVEPDQGDAIPKDRTLVRFQSACRRSDYVYQDRLREDR